MALEKFLGSTWTIGGSAILGVISCQLAGGTADSDDITTAADTVAQVRQGLEDSGTFTLNLRRNFSDTGQLALMTLWTSGNSATLVWTFPSGDALSMSVFVTGMPLDFGRPGGHLTGSCEMKITGLITQTPD